MKIRWFSLLFRELFTPARQPKRVMLFRYGDKLVTRDNRPITCNHAIKRRVPELGAGYLYFCSDRKSDRRLCTAFEVQVGASEVQPRNCPPRIVCFPEGNFNCMKALHCVNFESDILNGQGFRIIDVMGRFWKESARRALVKEFN
jgi:hypothetical protein